MKTRRIRPRCQSRGFTLVEMLLVIGGVTIVLSLIGGFLHLLMSLDRNERNYLQDTLTVANLAEQFRADVHAAAEVENQLDPAANPSKQATKLVLKSPGGSQVSYAMEGSSLLRRHSIEGKPTRQERYGVGRLGPVLFSVKDKRVEMAMQRELDHAPSAFRSKLNVVAILSKHQTVSTATGK